MPNPFDADPTTRSEEVHVIRLSGGVRQKIVRVLSDITIDDLMMNSLKAEAYRQKTGQGEIPTYGREITDYLLHGGRVTR